MRREILNAIRASMGSQCSCFSVGVMWSLGLRSFIRRAAVCSTEDKGCSVDDIIQYLEGGYSMPVDSMDTLIHPT